jgi:DNA modification methylase
VITDVLDGKARHALVTGDMRDIIPSLPNACIDACVTDPPYGLSDEPDIAEVMRHWLDDKQYTHKSSGFMGKSWDSFVPGPEYWRHVYRVMKPGAYALVFAGTRTSDLMSVALRFAGFEIVDSIHWCRGTGFPKGIDVSKAIDKRGGSSVSWFGPWFRDWRRRRGISSNQVAELFPSATGGITGCVRNWELGLNLPTPDQFNLIRDTYNLPFESIEEAEREVVGERTTGIGTGGGFTSFIGDSDNRNITASATEAAKKWDGFKSQLKPAHEPVIVCRRPLEGTFAENAMKHGTGAFNVDACRIPGVPEPTRYDPHRHSHEGWRMTATGDECAANAATHNGRYPSNFILTHAADCTEDACAGGCPVAGMDEQSGDRKGCTSNERFAGANNILGKQNYQPKTMWYGDRGGGSRFFFTCRWDERTDMPFMYCPKASSSERNIGGKCGHPTIKPFALIQYLCRLVCPPGGVVLDPFLGSGTTVMACLASDFRCIDIEENPEYAEWARNRIAALPALLTGDKKSPPPTGKLRQKSLLDLMEGP